VFWSFRVMVGMGFLMLAVSWWAAWQLRSTRVDPATRRPVLRTLAAMTFAGWVATLAGWWVTEIGRQPFIVYGLLRSSEVVGDHAPGIVATTLAAYLALYVALLAAYVGVLKYMAEKN
jgi:cytochrome d ubiquinol oxidase subunit I